MEINKMEVVQRRSTKVVTVMEAMNPLRSTLRSWAQGPRAESGKEGNGCKRSTDAENGLVESQRVSGSLATLATTGQVGKGPGHCSALDPRDPDLSAVPQEESHESELSSLMSKRPAQAGEAEEEEERHPNAAENKHGGEDRSPLAIIKETNMQDGSVQYISQHATHCAFTFQNTLLYELD